ncbi:MAG TPA: oxidoreductase [Bacteroidales bacterium]|nr:oxidoreductase [Bacteroidales bacterium]
MKNVLEGKVVILTGSRRGIGKGCIEPLLEAGATVVGCAKGSDPEHEIKTGVIAELLRNCYYYRQCDVSRPAELEDFIHFVAKTFGKIDCLVNNAGVHPPTRRIDDFTVEEFIDLFQVNLLSMFVACKAALPYLRKVSGTIINMGSAVGKYGQEGATIYCATKGGISGFTKALAIDEGRYGVRVNAILPGSIYTPATEQWTASFTNSSEKLSEIKRWSWLGRLGTVKEVGDAVVFLASDMSGFMTGHELLLTGGTELGYGIKAPENVEDIE